MKRTHDITVVTGIYKDREGNEKKRYTKIGTLFLNDNGRIKVKIDNAHPTMDGGWNGWADAYEITEEQTQRQRVKAGFPEDVSDIPF